MVKLKDIAEATDTSVSTVSRVLNNDNNLKISIKKASNIKETAKKMGYKIKNKSNKINIALYTWYELGQDLQDPYYLAMRCGVESYAKEKNIHVRIINRSDIFDFQLDEYDFDGVIVLGKFSEKEAGEFKKLSNNIVFVDYNPNIEEFISVETNLYDSMKKSLKELFSKDEDICYITGEEYFEDGKLIEDLRLKAYKDFCKDNKLETNIIYTKFTMDGGYSIVDQVKGYKNIQCASDSIAIGLMRGLVENKSNINNKCIVGFNDIAFSSFMNPSLTTTKVNTLAMGKEAMKIVIDNIYTKEYIVRQVYIPTKLIKRESHDIIRRK